MKIYLDVTFERIGTCLYMRVDSSERRFGSRMLISLESQESGSLEQITAMLLSEWECLLSQRGTIVSKMKTPVVIE